MTTAAEAVIGAGAAGVFVRTGVCMHMRAAQQLSNCCSDGHKLSCSTQFRPRSPLHLQPREGDHSISSGFTSMQFLVRLCCCLFRRMPCATLHQFYTHWLQRNIWSRPRSTPILISISVNSSTVVGLRLSISVPCQPPKYRRQCTGVSKFPCTIQ